ncbi:MAG TPA: abortive phage resistance protein, partial [Gammaproteobacteria bacterium]|nr:abortive phage resistance protein [Gammaproteobacteria bacterium]
NSPYVSHYIAMLVGRKLLAKAQLKLGQVDHRNFTQLKEILESNADLFHQQALDDLSNALTQCYGKREISLQQPSARFRRGDLLEML